ncbi:MAG: hypothetical protein LUO79_04425 [Methanomassiliicoccales archaeon]|nr:hypothetical protein [Methanomassiliicoccales archaeon]
MKKPSGNWTYCQIPKERTPTKEDSVPIIPLQSYVRVKLTHMFLEFQRYGTEVRMPVVHAYPRFTSCDGQTELPVVLGPGKLKADDGEHLHRLITLNQTVFGPVPYLGGDLDLPMALFAVPTVNYADEFFDLLGNASALAPTIGIKAAMSLVQPIEKGVEKLLGMGNAMTIGIQDTFSSPAEGVPVNPLTTGYRVLIGQHDGAIDPDELWVAGDGIHLSKNGSQGDPLKNCDYLVFCIESIAERDWRQLQTLSAKWQKVEEAVSVGGGRPEVVETAWKMFGYDLLSCGDLLMSQRTKVLDIQKGEKDKLLAAMAQVEKVSAAKRKARKEIEEMARAVPSAKAKPKAKAEPTIAMAEITRGTELKADFGMVELKPGVQELLGKDLKKAMKSYLD